MKRKHLLPLFLAFTLSMTACTGAPGQSETPIPQETETPSENEDQGAQTQEGAEAQAEDTQTAAENTDPDSEAAGETEAAGEEAAEDEGTGEADAVSDASGPEASESDEALPEEDAAAEDAAAESEENAYADCYAAYYQHLTEHMQTIAAYDWQNIEWTDEGRVYHPDYKVAIADVYGDDAPELLYMEGANPTDDGYYFVASLNIVTLENGELKTLYSEVLDAEVAGGTSFSVFTVKDHKEPVVYYDIGDEGWTWTYLELASGDGILSEAGKAERSEYPNEDYTATEKTFRIDGEDTDEESFNAYRQSLLDNFDQLIFFGDVYDEDILKIMDEKGWIGMGYIDALAFLEDGASSVLYPQAEPVDADAFFSSLQNYDFYFASGVGGWGTELTLSEDGTFEGNFHDSDMGDTGEGYEHGTVYVSDFTGRFDHVRKIDDFTYLVSLAEITVAQEGEENWIEDDIRYVASAPYGIDQGKLYIFYMPGKPIAEMDEEAVDWYRMPRGLYEDTIPEVLPCYGIYTKSAGTAFFSGDVE